MKSTKRSNVPGTIYIGRFDRAIGNPNVRGGTATYYLGWTETDPQARWAAHEAGQGAKITSYVVSQNIGIEWKIVETGVTRERERRLKSNGHYERLYARACAQEGK